jgi:hypothetical protein
MGYKEGSISDYYKGVSDAIRAHRNRSLPSSPSFGYDDPRENLFGFLGDSLYKRLPDFTIGGMTLSPFQGDVGDQLRKYAEGYGKNLLLGGLFREVNLQEFSDRFNQALEERGYLKFKFGDTEPLLLPFFENPVIQESRASEYVKHKIMNRNEPYRVFTGASPSKIKVTFHMTLPHIMYFGIASKHSTPVNYADSPFAASSIERDAASFIEELNSDLVGNENTFPYDQREKDLLGPGDNNYNRILSLVGHYVNLIRSSLITSVDSTRNDGPPLVELAYGTLYPRETFIATSYSLKFDEKAGYDNKTLFPRRLTVSLSLESYNQKPGEPPNSWRDTLGVNN